MMSIVPIRRRELIPIIEGWLEQAQRGEIKVMAFAAVMSDETCCEGWIGDHEDNAMLLYAAVNILRESFFHTHIDHYSDADRGRS